MLEKGTMGQRAALCNGQLVEGVASRERQEHVRRVLLRPSGSCAKRTRQGHANNPQRGKTKNGTS